MTPVNLLDAEKIAEAVFLYVFRIQLTASLLPQGGSVINGATLFSLKKSTKRNVGNKNVVNK